jgi:hypothetical protein
MALLCLASSVRMVGTYTLAAYLPVVYQRVYYSQTQNFSLLNGLGFSVCG